MKMFKKRSMENRKNTFDNQIIQEYGLRNLVVNKMNFDLITNNTDENLTDLDIPIFIPVEKFNS